METDPQAGHEQKGIRPALVLSPEKYNGKTGLAILCPITSQVKGYPFEVAIPAGLKTKGVILSDQIRSLDWKARKVSFLCRADSSTVEEVQAKILTLIDE